ncbi:glycosyltransferase family 4 protein [Spirosoma radiotolerans]|uniref:glycosyltransferase family 4 protein n=1 Tax=Spirosoma radiotolerans TaxID=1379870 RepID=UPI000696B206|nr:glycosyltransferase family 1 protein [Spirosoma radiotolerans]
MDNTQKAKLALDAKWYFEGPPSGRMVLRNIVDQLLVQKNDYELYLFVQSKHRKEAVNVWGDMPYVHLIFVPKLITLLSNVLLLHFYALYYKVDVVLFQNYTTFLPGSYKKLVYIHDILFVEYPEYYSLKEYIYFKPMIWLAKWADAIITISDTERGRLIRHNIFDRKNIFVVHHGISENFKELSSYNAHDILHIYAKYTLPDKFILYVGRLNVRKNILNLVNSVHLMQDKSVKLIIAGGKRTDDKRVNALITRNGLDDRVIFLGFVPDNDLYKLYACSYIFCFPSFAEGFGLPPLEAMKCGVPVIVSNRTSLPEVCGTAALYIDPDDSQGLADSIDKLLANELFYAMMKAKAIEHSAAFTWKNAVDQLLTIMLAYGPGKTNSLHQAGS